MYSVSVPSYLIPENEAQRLSCLYAYKLIDTPSDPVLDAIVLKAMSVFDVPCGFISLVDREEVFFKSNISNAEGRFAPRFFSFCAMALNNPGMTVFEDTHLLPRLQANPLLQEPFCFRFYASAPLVAPEGFRLGCICVADWRPHKISDAAMNSLEAMADNVMDYLNRLRA